jgi:MFS family permease
MPVGASAFLLLDAGSSPLLAGAGSLVIGFGMGCLSTASMVIVQNAVGWTERGVATASQMFARSLGSTLGATVLGGVLNMSLASAGTTVKPDQIRELLERAGEAGGAGAVRTALGHALHLTFWGVFVLAVLTFLVSLLAPRVRIDGPEAAKE